MNKKIMTAGVVLGLVSTLALTGCQPGQNTGGATVVGTAAGALIGSQIFSNQTVGAIAGGLVGGSIGYAVGRHMDRQDRINMQSAIVNTPDGQTATWTNSRTDVTYQVQPTRSYRHNNRYCRDYKTRIKVEGRWQNGYGRACRMPDGRWKIVK